VCVVAIAYAVLAMLPSSSDQFAVAQLPPRPDTPAPVAKPAPSAARGAFIELRAEFPAAWPWETSHWRDLQTVVQWQDPWGMWHDVEGWQGTLDGVEVGEDGAVVGLKLWWVGGADLGTGPFRWRVTHGQGGRLLGTSEPFGLPSAANTTLTVEVSLTQ